MEQLKQSIIDAVKKAQTSEIYYEEVYNDTSAPHAKHEFLMFIKPEMTLVSNTIKFPEIVAMILEKTAAMGLTIHATKVLSAKYMEDYDIIGKHYGVINAIAADAKNNMSASAKKKFQEVYGVSVEESNVMWWREFLEAYPHFNAYSLDHLRQNTPNTKLAWGTYCEDLKFDGTQVYLVNGFLPKMLKHFTEDGRSIVVFVVSGDVDWATVRADLIGATRPREANEGSIRRYFFDNKDALGLVEVSQGLNGLHLSAGPLEALIELQRYDSNFADASKITSFTDYSIGQSFASSFDAKTFETILNNPNVDVDGKSTSLFDLTEEKNLDESIELIKKYM